MNFWKDFLDIVFPPVCVVCKKHTTLGPQLICNECTSSLPVFENITGTELQNEIVEKFPYEIKLLGGYAYLKYYKAGLVKKMLVQIKYRHQWKLAVTLGRWFGHELKSTEMARRIDGLVPVPLHKSRLRKRGYNQSEMVAKGMEEILKKPVLTDSLIRTVATKTQTMKGRMERWDNVKDVFEVKDDTLKGKCIMLVDDVMTTGATLEACIRQLNKAGVHDIYVAALALAKKG